MITIPFSLVMLIVLLLLVNYFHAKIVVLIRGHKVFADEELSLRRRRLDEHNFGAS